MGSNLELFAQVGGSYGNLELGLFCGGANQLANFFEEALEAGKFHL